MKQLFFILLILPINTLAQYYQPVFPELEEEELRVAVKDSYKPTVVLPFGVARDTMFARIDARNDSLTCVYTGHTIYLNPDLDPTEAAYMNGSSNGINTEHTYPQAFGAGSGNPRADMHHLFPTRSPVNTARGNLPFGEIPDNQTDTWFYLNQESSSIPGNQIDLYSEISDNHFEPREDHKGDVARAMFYFYLMYTAEANAGNPTFFEAQRSTFCEWHFNDPVSEKEWNRTWGIARYQDDKPNPFVLDCSVAARLYCTEFEANCAATPTDEIDQSQPFQLEGNLPNPFSEATTIRYSLREAFNVKLILFNTLGQVMTILVDEKQMPGNYEVELNQSQLVWYEAGNLYYQLQLTGESKTYFLPGKIVYLPH